MADRGSPLGYDTFVGPVPEGGVDMLPAGDACSGATLVRNGMVARCLADTISMIGAPGDVIEFGVNVRAWVGSPVTDSTATRRAAELAVVFARDPRVDAGSITVDVAATAAGSQYDFTITINARTVTGVAISMVLGVNAITVDILAQQGA